MENDMTPLKEIGECLIGAGERGYFFRPSFRNMTRIGEPEHIVRTFYALFNDDVAKMLEAAREIHSAIPEHQRRFYAHYFGDVSLPGGLLMQQVQLLLCVRHCSRLLTSFSPAVMRMFLN
jgi:hypothetical protein